MKKCYVAHSRRYISEYLYRIFVYLLITVYKLKLKYSDSLKLFLESCIIVLSLTFYYHNFCLYSISCPVHQSGVWSYFRNKCRSEDYTICSDTFHTLSSRSKSWLGRRNSWYSNRNCGRRLFDGSPHQRSTAGSLGCKSTCGKEGRLVFDSRRRNGSRKCEHRSI